jgi:hypothetical protein
MHMWEGRGTKVTFPPPNTHSVIQTSNGSQQWCKDQHNRSTATFNGYFHSFNKILYAPDWWVLYIMLDGWPNPEPQAFPPCPAGPRWRVRWRGPNRRVRKEPKGAPPSLHRVHPSHVALTWTHVNIVGGRITRLHPWLLAVRARNSIRQEHSWRELFSHK